ncbi:MAG: DUF192 domain-containing protein [Phycisphaerae bacterium]
MDIRLILALSALHLAGCAPDEPNRLDALKQADVTVKDHTFHVWVAQTSKQREKGLMFVTAEQIKPLPNGHERGMIFLFPQEQSKLHGFWMKNTIIPLDIAYIRTDGTIVSIHTMAPLDTRTYRPKAPYRFALEVRGNLFAKLKITTGDKVQIPKSLLKDLAKRAE